MTLPEEESLEEMTNLDMTSLDLANLDRVLGGVAIAFLLAGMFMLFGGVSTLGQESGKEDGKNGRKNNLKNNLKN